VFGARWQQDKFEIVEDSMANPCVGNSQAVAEQNAGILGEDVNAKLERLRHSTHA
jgi:hypothetical protein